MMIDNDMQVINEFRYKRLVERFGKDVADEIFRGEGEEIPLSSEVDAILASDDTELFVE